MKKQISLTGSSPFKWTWLRRRSTGQWSGCVRDHRPGVRSAGYCTIFWGFLMLNCLINTLSLVKEIDRKSILGQHVAHEFASFIASNAEGSEMSSQSRAYFCAHICELRTTHISFIIDFRRMFHRTKNKFFVCITYIRDELVRPEKAWPDHDALRRLISQLHYEIRIRKFYTTYTLVLKFQYF